MHSFSYDRPTMLVLMISATLPFLAVAPAKAAPAASAPVSCDVQASELRAAAQAAPPQAASRALRNVRLAEQICAEGNRREAGKKFDLARRQLDPGVQMADRR